MYRLRGLILLNSHHCFPAGGTLQHPPYIVPGWSENIPGGLRARLGRADSPLSFYADLAQILYSHQVHAHMLNLLNFGPI